MMKKIAGTVLAGIAAMMLTTTAFAGSYVSGYHLAVTDDCAGTVNGWGAGDFPVDIDLDCGYASVRINNSGAPVYYNFNRQTGNRKYVSDEGWELDASDCNNIRMLTYDGVFYICR